jgi:hypothetical protein
MNEFQGLTKKEKRALKKKLELEKRGTEGKKKSSKKLIYFLSIAGVFFAIFYWFYREYNAPKPGEFFSDLGRDHVPLGTVSEYNSNPPTSGPHYEEWTKAGIYDEPLDDRNLIHSLEHGYIIVSYNCNVPETQDKSWKFPSFTAHAQTPEVAESSSTPSASVDISHWQDDASCKSLVSDLTKLSEEVRLNRLIIIPRPNLDKRIALTAWTRLDKFNTFDKNRIKTFVNAYRNKGPEQTME